VNLDSEVWAKAQKPNLVAVDGAVDAGVEIGDLVVREPALVHIVSSDVGGAEVDVGRACSCSTNPGGGSYGSALLEGDELLEVVKIGEHLRQIWLWPREECTKDGVKSACNVKINIYQIYMLVARQTKLPASKQPFDHSKAFMAQNLVYSKFGVLVHIWMWNHDRAKPASIPFKKNGTESDT
jgi:hypothetical protein